jgi:hypothetical protein
MSVKKLQPGEPAKVLILTQEAAGEICKKHGHRKAAQEIVDALPNRVSLNSAKVDELVRGQILHFEQNLVKCVEHANQAAGKVDKLPDRSEQGAALREIGEALENLRDAVERNWDLAGPLLEIDTTEQLGRLLTNDAAPDLMPADLRSEYIKNSENKNEYLQQQLKLSYLLDGGSQPLVQLILGATKVVRRAEAAIKPGAPTKDPLGLSLMMQLAQHYEGILRKKATRTARGSFMRFCEDVFVNVGLETESGWEYLLKEGLKHHRTSFGWRRLHEPPEDMPAKTVWTQNRNRRTTQTTSPKDRQKRPHIKRLIP